VCQAVHLLLNQRQQRLLPSPLHPAAAAHNLLQGHPLQLCLEAVQRIPHPPTDRLAQIATLPTLLLQCNLESYTFTLHMGTSELPQGGGGFNKRIACHGPVTESASPGDAPSNQPDVAGVHPQRDVVLEKNLYLSVHPFFQIEFTFAGCETVLGT